MYMKKRTLIIILGLWIAFIPVLGLPNSWKNRIVSISALAIVVLVYTKSAPVRPLR